MWNQSTLKLGSMQMFTQELISYVHPLFLKLSEGFSFLFLQQATTSRSVPRNNLPIGLSLAHLLSSAFNQVEMDRKKTRMTASSFSFSFLNSFEKKISKNKTGEQNENTPSETKGWMRTMGKCCLAPSTWTAYLICIPFKLNASRSIHA